MSDGPYKSLPMKRAWKDVSERAHKPSYTSDEREQSMCVAFHKDFKREVGKEFLNAVGHVLVEQQQQNLLSDQADFEVNAIKEKFSQSPLRDAVAEHTQVALYQGFKGEEALVEGVNRATQEHGHAHVRQVEEHYKRDASNYSEARKAVSVRNNLLDTLSSFRVRNFGKEIVSLIRGEVVPTKLFKASGLDDGVELRA